MQSKLKCLLVHPEFTSTSFWNYRATCHLQNAKYPASPLGLITVASMLPQSWDCKLVDCNAQELQESEIQWADVVLSGGMISQQREHITLIERTKKYTNKIHIVGGTDATESPHLYDRADYLVLGEAEITLPKFLKDFEQSQAQHIYTPGEKKADMTKTPVPRFDLLNFNNYLHVGVQFGRGCPFTCEFCDIIELFGRVPRVKDIDQIMGELQTLYDLGYRGHVDLVDDNFIGNKKAVRELLPVLYEWQKQHHFPFEFSTEASINLADDEKFMKMMQDVNFVAVFVGIETPDPETLVLTQKKQNTRRSIAESIHRITQHGMIVNAGYIVGFDNEPDHVADSIIQCIEDTAIPVNMTGLLFALPNTQLTRRLLKEGRLETDYEQAPENIGDQCLAGLNFETTRPKVNILRDYLKVIKEVYDPKKYFARVRRTTLMLDCSKKHLHLPLRMKLRDLRGLCRLMYKMGLKAPYRSEFWKSFFYAIFNNPKSVRYSVAMIALYLHFGPFTDYVIKQIAQQIDRLEKSCPSRKSTSVAMLDHCSGYDHPENSIVSQRL